ncbi:hypothetical protein TW65_01806 [Stemphylium lycopersici]|nr:hypothetical protein TW65_01806 [Stemphylium lycopersici]
MAPRTLLTAMRPLRTPMTLSTRRAFATTPRMAIKEDATRNAEEIEQAKQEQLKEQKKGQGRWREDLASSGESSIAADRQQVNDHDEHMKELQQEGKKKGEKGEIRSSICPPMSTLRLKYSRLYRLVPQPTLERHASKIPTQPRLLSMPFEARQVIDMTERIVKPRNRKKEATRATATTREEGDTQSAAKITPDSASSQAASMISALDVPLNNPMFPAERRHPDDVEKAMTAIRHHYRPPTYNQPSRVLPEALDTAFISHYVELNKSGQSYAPEIQWLGHLPNIHGNATKPAVRLSLRAVSMAFYGKHHNDSSILIDSWRWYTVALGAQRTSIARMKKNCIPDEEEVLVPLILALYELYVGATASGSMAHLNAAGEIMNMRGPSNCRSGAIWPLFKGIRSQDAHRSIIWNKKSIYSSPDWLTIPFVGMPRDPHQALADIELMIPHCTAYLGIQGTIRVVFTTPIPLEADVTSCKELTCRVIGDLNQWAEEYPHLTRPSSSPATNPAPEHSSMPASPSRPDKQSPRKTGLQGAFVALIASNYIADRLVLNMLMYKMHTESSAPIASYENTTAHYFSEAQDCSQAILKAAHEIEQAQTPGFDLLRSIAPVVTVGFCAPTMQLRKEAMEMMYRWGSKVGGLASIFERM